MTRVLALDHGAARCGAAVSDPSGTLATPLTTIARPDSPAGLEAIADLVRETCAELVVVGLPLTLRGEEGEQAAAARAFAGRVAKAAGVRVELHDERLTTSHARRTGGSAGEDGRAAARILESWLESGRVKR
ncbi:MAG: Holliday junction resolvase RuvX [Actinobacteria bacterium]|nr:MAG: Holliday junction resolvase RuvX [Actinomycetota bacterium]